MSFLNLDKVVKLVAADLLEGVVKLLGKLCFGVDLTVSSKLLVNPSTGLFFVIGEGEGDGS